MGDRVDRNCIPSENTRNVREAVCIDTKRVYDSCKDKECLRDLRVYFPRCTQPLVDRAISVKAKSAEIIWVATEVEGVPFNKGCYSSNISYFFKIAFDVYTGMGQPCQACGMATYDKTAILFGSEGSAKTFSSKFVADGGDTPMGAKTNLPEVAVEVVDPIVLAARIDEICNCSCGCGCDMDMECIPRCVYCCFEDELITNGEKVVLVTLGLFSIIRLMRKVQLLVPIYDFCIPQKECDYGMGGVGDPCELFEQFQFPLDQFFPPTTRDSTACGYGAVDGIADDGACNYTKSKRSGGCGC
jgi:hypothetical protein